MALQSEVSLPLIGDTNKDTKIDGDTKRSSIIEPQTKLLQFSPCNDDNDNDNDTSQSTEDEVDLEEGEILDSGEEEESKENTQSQLKEALDIKCLKTIEKLAASPVKSTAHADNNAISTKRHSKPYLDHDHVKAGEDSDAWYPPSPKYKSASKFSDGPIDYRKELQAYMGSPSSSPERKSRKEKKSREKKSSKSSKSKSSRKTLLRKEKKGVRVSKTRKKEVKKLCKFYKEGKCSKGSDCQFAHLGPTKKRELCKFYISNSCFKGKNCTYMHADFPCKFYHTGSRCFADENCRYSHAPLTDETKTLLAEYLGNHHGDDLDSRKRHRSPSRERTPPQALPAKRPCILGSPPRHIKEAEETKRWQEEMKHLQQQNQPGFEIHFDPSFSPEEHFSRPNFYAETLQNSPSPKNRFPHGRAHSPMSRQRMLSQGFEEPNEAFMGPHGMDKEVGGVNWRNVNDLIHRMSGPQDLPHVKEEPMMKQEPDFTSDMNLDETTQFTGHMGSPINLLPSSGHSAAAVDNDENDTEEYDEGGANGDDDQDSNNDEAYNQNSPNRDESDDNQPSKPLPPPIVIPNHLPRKQRELFLRIQQHQRRNLTISNVMGSPESNDKTENQDSEREERIKECVKQDVKDQSKWYSSEEEDDDDDNNDDDDDDDDDTDLPLTNVLKKLQEEPPKQIPPAKPSVNLLEMLSKIKHPGDSSKPLMNAQNSQGAFWESILTGAVPPNPVTASLSVPSNPQEKRRTLLPDPPIQMTPVVEKKEIVVPKDPRLKNRDPRTLSASNIPTVVAPKFIPDASPKLTLSTTPSPQPKINDITKLFPKPAVPETPKDSKDTRIPYKLYGIYAKPPNYMPYIHASQSDPKLLNDPRLRRHIIQVSPGSQHNDNADSSKESFASKPPIKEVAPPIPPLLLQRSKPEGKLSIDIFETNSSCKTSTVIPKTAEPKLITAARRLSDPRIRTRDVMVEQSSSGSNTPPHLTIVEPCLTPPQHQEFKHAPILESALSDFKPETKWPQPILEKNWLPPVLEKNISISSCEEKSEITPLQLPVQGIPKVSFEQSLDLQNTNNLPTIEQAPIVTKKLASHLPRAIADPRMAKLHHPLDPRRRAISVDANAKSSSISLSISKTESTQVVVKTEPAGIKEECSENPREGVTIKTEPTDWDILVKNECFDDTIAANKEPITVKTEPSDGDLKNIPESDIVMEPLEDATSVKTSVDLLSNINAVPIDDAQIPQPDSTSECLAPKVKESAPKLKSRTIPKRKKTSEKSEEKKKTIHRNRKSSMDYASPLNSCDDSNSANKLGYNTYNQRLRRKTVKPSNVSLPTSSANATDTNLISEFMLSDNSNQECDNDVNLKDMFKTIDPTASPFC